MKQRLEHPVIGFTLDYETGGGYSKMPWYAIRENYLTAISRLGGIPLPLPHELHLVDHYFEMIDALVVTGGAFDIPPEFYGETSRHEKVTVLKERRTAFESAMTRKAIDQKKPLLAICGGQQLLGVLTGGTLIQHIPDKIADALAHEQPNPRTEPGHTVSIAKGTLLHRIVGADTIEVNSAHHQAVDKVGRDVVIDATAPDGVVEGIELPSHPFCLGVQWHPEYIVSDADNKIMAAFVEASKAA
jgi:putative glutamine amidotransferase